MFSSLNPRNSIGYLVNVKFRSLRFFYKYLHSEHELGTRPAIVGMLRERNESLLLADTLNHLATIVDCIVVFDDASTDNSVDIALSHPKVVQVIQNKHWKPNKRKWEETANRNVLYRAAKGLKPDWFFYADADERFEGDIRNYLLGVTGNENVQAVRVGLLDAYITKNDSADYKSNMKLLGFRDKFGVERRDILMAWKQNRQIKYLYPDSREPAGVTEGSIEYKFWCQHYGKALSIQQWEDTCDYYANSFPQYSEKWRNRKGKAIHNKSDFGTRLYSWHTAKKKSIKIH